MALQVPLSPKTNPASLSPSPQHGLRAPANAMALKSSFFNGATSISHFLPPHAQKPATLALAPKFSMRVSSKQAYICLDCGYIYNDRTPFEKLPDKFLCPVCGAPKRRFRPYELSVAKNPNDTDVRKARKAQIKRDEAVGRALPVGIVIGVVGLAGLYFYLNNAFQ
ncbi:hypothetical protein AMTRI_Chr06g192680 [Amborella trichopoda]|uniref:Rubredoxin-like domain-containing protein n=1 Tax=Amborella trichopoda TaxID=13333 RepID=W1PEJ9_AMBTC|nr:uncharacterized protein LOC18434313 [Amborella trichopoda]ERN06124.1 hypothetical protein AMTR_s00016p00073950 [Amborella trichopoda]|eukprot:XP_006844449.1 uncharacterized protein LOC18434313 [Amborella trichopoda]